MERSPAPGDPGSTPAGWGKQTRKSFSLLHPPGRRGVTMVVPDTPSNTPTFTMATPEVTEVLETPDGLEEWCGATGDMGLGSGGSVGHSGKSGVSAGGVGGNKRQKPKSQGLFKLRRQSLVSLLESEFAQKQQDLEGSSDSASISTECDVLFPKREKQWSKVHSALGVAGKRQQSGSLANIILPFDLNDDDCLATKLSHIQQEEEKKGGQTKCPHARRRSTATPTTSDSPRASTRTPKETRTDQQHGFSSPGVRQRLGATSETPETAASANRRHRATHSSITQMQNDNNTIYFMNEDLLMTPVNHGQVFGRPRDRKRESTPLHYTPNNHTLKRAKEGATNHLQSPVLHSAMSNLTPQHAGPPEDTPLGQRAKEDIRKKLQMPKSPPLCLKKYNATATQRLTEILTGRSPGKDRGEKREEQEAGEGKEGDCQTSLLLSTPSGNPAVGGSVSGGSVSSSKDPGSVLKGVVAYVEVRVERDNRSAVIREQLEALGAQVDSRLTRNTTHVIFREGSMSVFLRAKERGLHILSSLWVEACRVSQSRAPENMYPSTSLETYSSGLHLPKKRFRRLKSMQPRDFSEDEKRAAARVQRKYKKAAAAAAAAAMTDSAPTETVPAGLCTPRHRVIKEDVNSPLFGIGHLLSPHHKDSDTSTCGEEDEESESDDICTPLAQRLYKRYMSGQKEGRRIQEDKEEEEEEARRIDKEEEQEGQTSGGGADSEKSGDVLRGEEDGAKCSDEGSLKLRLEESDSSSRRPSLEVSNESNSSSLRPQRCSSDTSQGESLPRRLVGKVQVDGKELKASQRLTGRTEGGESDSEAPEMNEWPRRLITKRNNTKFTTATTTSTTSPLKRKRGAGGGREAQMEPDCRQAHPSTSSSSSSSLDVPRRRQSMRLASRAATVSQGCAGDVPRGVGWCNSPSEESPSKRHKHSSSPEKKSNAECNTAHPGGKRRMDEGGRAAKPSTSSSTKSPRNTKEGTTTFAAKQNKPPTTSYVTAEDTKGSEAEIPASQIEFPYTQATCSQRGRRRLMCLEEDITPSQDLIKPATPNPEERRNGPYANILHPPPPRAKNKRHNRQLFTQKSPHAQTKSQRGEPSNLGGSSESASSNGGQVRLRSGSESQDPTTSSGEDSVFTEPRLGALPRPRRSTEEFKMGFGGFPMPKTSVRRRQSKRRSSRRISAPSSLLCLTSLHSSDKRTVLPIIRKLGGYKVGERVDHRTSHVVCGEQRRTLNLLLGIARGCWVLDVSWVYRSLEGDAWAPEEPFELGTFAPAAKVCRRQRQAQGSSYQHTLFSGVGRVCVLDGCTPPSAQLKELLELCGASLVSSVRSARLVVGSSASPSIRTIKHSSLVTHVSEKWVLDSIQHHRLHPVQDYLLS